MQAVPKPAFAALLPAAYITITALCRWPREANASWRTACLNAAISESGRRRRRRKEHQGARNNKSGRKVRKIEENIK